MPPSSRPKDQASELDRIVDIFRVDRATAITAPAPSQPKAQQPRPEKTDARGLQHKVRQAAGAYLTNGNAAVDTDWNEF